MLTKEEYLISPFTRKIDTMLTGAAHRGKLGQYLNSILFEETILQYGDLADRINEVYRRSDINELKNMQLYQQKIHSQFLDALYDLYSINGDITYEQQNDYFYKNLKGKFFDVSELETKIQLIPVSVDPDIVQEVLQRHPAAAFKTYIGNQKKLDIIYDSNDKYYL